MIAEGTYPADHFNKDSMIGSFLAKMADMRVRTQAGRGNFCVGKAAFIYGSYSYGKAIGGGYSKGKAYRCDRCVRFREDHDGLESLIPGLEASFRGEHLPKHVKCISAEGISHVKLIDASPIGINVRSTVATYANIHDELRKIYAKTADAKNREYKAGIFPTIPETALPGL